MATTQPLADLSNLGGGAANASSIDIPGASTQAALDRLLGGGVSASNVGAATVDCDAGGHSGWQPRGRAGLATAKASAVVFPKALKRNSNANAAATKTNAAAAAANDAGAEADDDASPPSSEGRTRDAGATPPMRIGNVVGGGEEGKVDDAGRLNGHDEHDDDDDDDDDDEENRNDENGHESSSSGPCQLPPLAARSAIVKRRMAAAANRVSWCEEKEKEVRFFHCVFQLQFSFFLFLRSPCSRLKNKKTGREDAHARGVERGRGRRR